MKRTNCTLGHSTDFECPECKEDFITKTRKCIITEHDIQNAEAIEFSYSGELVPMEVVEDNFSNVIKQLKESIEEAQEDYANLDWISKDHTIKIIDKIMKSQKEKSK